MQYAEWLDGLDFNQDVISRIPEMPGVFMMHAAMKVLHGKGSKNN